MGSKLLPPSLKGRLSNLLLKPRPSLSPSSFSLLEASALRSGTHLPSPLPRHPPPPRRTFSSPPTSGVDPGPAAIDYSSLIKEEEFHRLANVTVHDLQEKIEEYGDSVQIDGFDVEYGNEVLTVKLGSKGTYVLNKQTPNRQLWLSSPVSGPSRYDWDSDARTWIYRRTKSNLFRVLENELEQLCGEPIKLA